MYMYLISHRSTNQHLRYSKPGFKTILFPNVYVNTNNLRHVSLKSEQFWIFEGIHHYYTLHRLSVQIEVPSRGSISKKKLVCLYKFGMIFFRRVFSTTYLKMKQFFASTFFDIYWFLKTQRFRVIMIASQPRSVLCVHAPLRFLKSKKFLGFCADFFRRYSQLPAKPKFGQIKCNHTVDISKIRKHQGLQL